MGEGAVGPGGPALTVMVPLAPCGLRLVSHLDLALLVIGWLLVLTGLVMVVAGALT